jgi:hypothetical protein
VKLATLTSSLRELEELVPVLRDLYFSGEAEIICLVNSEAESKLQANPACHRTLREFTSEPLDPTQKLKEKSLVSAARNALVEERPDLILWPTRTFLRAALHPTIHRLGIGEYQLGQGLETSVQAILRNLRSIDEAAEPREPGRVTAKEFLAPHWAELEDYLQSPCLLHSTPQLSKLCSEKFPHITFHPKPEQDQYPLALSLLGLSFSEDPAKEITQLRELSAETLSLEPVNSPLVGARYNFCHGDYDSEFALVAPDFDLLPSLGKGHRTVIWDRRSGQAGPKALPHPDAKYPAFFTTWPERPDEQDWTSRFAIPSGEKLKIVFADSGNQAGSVFHHTEAINRFTDSEAWAVSMAPHPFIGPRTSTEHTFFTLSGAPTPALKQVLEEADCVVFFEDDDEDSPNWRFPLGDFLKEKPKVHLYLGYRVHARSPRLARTGRTLLTPLPHLLRMYPNSSFYAGFPPLLPESVEVDIPPQSSVDGICRFLHTPSLPHWTTGRYMYHEDTEAFLEAARKLKPKHGSKIEFHQVGGWSHEQLIKARQFCDVTFGQLRGFHGLSGDEAMMLGRPCVQYFDQSNVNRHLEYWGLETKFPWLSCRREGLAETFESLYSSPERRAEIGRESQRFMRKYFSPQKGILPLLYHCYRAVRGADYH